MRILDIDISTVAIVGASRNPNKWGYKVFKILLEKYPDLKAYPVNPNADAILGVKAFPNLKSLPEKPDMVITVVPPKITEKVVVEAVDLGVKLIWMQPGSESDKAIRYAQDHGVRVLHGVCFIETSKSENFPRFRVGYLGQQ